MPRLIAALLLFALPLSSPAADAETLAITLPEAIARALESNFRLKVESFGPQISQARITTELGRFDPVLESRYSRAEDTNRVALSSIDQVDSAQVGVGGLTPWGMTYEAAVDTRNARGTYNNFENAFDTGTRFALTQPLLEGFGPSANLAGLRIARVNKAGSDWQFKAEAIDLLTQVNFFYNELFSSTQNLEVARRSRALAEQLYEDNKRRTQIGVMSPLDVTTARAEVASRQEAVIVAERAVRDNENYLKQLISDQVEALLSTRLDLRPPPEAVPFPINVKDGIAEALTNRPDYQQALLEIKRLNITLALERNQSLPRLDLVGSLRLLGLGDDVSDSFARAVNRDQTAWSAGAVFSLPIPNRSGKGRVEVAKLNAARALVDLKRLEQLIVIRVDNSAGQIFTNRQRIVSTAEARKLAQESLDAGVQRLKAGTATTFEVLELQKKLAEAELSEIRARSDFNKAVAEFDRQTGTTLERNRVFLTRK